MALEDKIDALIVALQENTAAHAALGEIAKGAAKAPAKSTSKPAPKEEPEDDQDEDEDEAPKETAAEKKKRLAAEKKAKDAAAAKKAAASKKSSKPELPSEVDVAELRGLARTFMAKDHENRDANKENFAAALAHLGAENLSSVSEEDTPKLFGYITYWQAGLEVDFEEIDELVAGGSDGDADEDDDMLD